MRKYLFILLGLLFIFTASFVSAKVRFIISDDDADVFRYNCPSQYKACSDPKYGIGSPCGDKLYLSCKCPSNYNQTCTSPKVGIGLVCDGKYTGCQCPSEYNTYCTGSGASVVSGATACDGKYKLSECKCSGSYTSSTCASPKVTGGNACKISDSVTYYDECKCPSEYLKCNNGGAIGSDSCTDDEGEKFKSCKSSGTKYVNADGYLDFRNTTLAEIEVYGHYATLDLSPSAYLDILSIRYWGDITVKGDVTINGTLALVDTIYSVAPTTQNTITFEGKVVVNGVVQFDSYTSYVFKQGITGEFTCQNVYCSTAYSHNGRAYHCPSGYTVYKDVTCPNW